LTGIYNVVDLQTERLQREVDELRAQFNDLAHMVNQYVASLQGQLDGINMVKWSGFHETTEEKFQP
jgi:hypothetical protein